MSQIYLVVMSTGEYDSREEYPVGASTDHDIAEAFRAKMESEWQTECAFNALFNEFLRAQYLNAPKFPVAYGAKGTPVLDQQTIRQDRIAYDEQRKAWREGAFKEAWLQFMADHNRTDEFNEYAEVRRNDQERFYSVESVPIIGPGLEIPKE